MIAQIACQIALAILLAESSETSYTTSVRIKLLAVLPGAMYKTLEVNWPLRIILSAIYFGLIHFSFA